MNQTMRDVAMIFAALAIGFAVQGAIGLLGG